MIALVLVISLLGVFGCEKKTGIQSRKKLNIVAEDTAKKVND